MQCALVARGMECLLSGYISLRKGWHRCSLAAAAVPCAILGNFVRMLLLYDGTIWVSKDFAIGPDDHPSAFHTGAGIAVFIVALICMLVLVEVLNRGFKSLRRKRVRSRVVGMDEGVRANEKTEDSPSE